MGDLAAFLKARYDDDERYLRTMEEVGERGAARAAAKDMADVPGMAVSVLSDPAVRALMAQWVDGEVLPPNDLSRLLREAEVKREILAEHGPGRQDASRCRVCTAIADGRAARFLAPCPTLRALAAVYASHPGYDPEWA